MFVLRLAPAPTSHIREDADGVVTVRVGGGSNSDVEEEEEEEKASSSEYSALRFREDDDDDDDRYACTYILGTG